MQGRSLIAEADVSRVSQLRATPHLAERRAQNVGLDRSLQSLWSTRQGFHDTHWVVGCKALIAANSQPIGVLPALRVRLGGAAGRQVYPAIVFSEFDRRGASGKAALDARFI